MLDSVALQAATDFDQGGHVYAVPMLALPSHIRKLARTLIALENSTTAPGNVSLRSVYSLLNVAGALKNVSANTVIDDSSIYYCGAALDYAGAESAIASKYLAGTIMFNFTWMALEQAIQEVAPAGKGTAGARGRMAFSKPLIAEIDLDGPLKVAWSSATGAGDMAEDLHLLGRLLPSAPRPEVAFELVRRVRNAFAHGSLIPPQPTDWGDKAPSASHPEVDRFFACSRLALLLIAMLLASRFGVGMMEQHHEDRPYLEDSDDDLVEVPIVWALQTAHLGDPWLPPEVAVSQVLELAHGCS